ncbi:hypothetical protein A5886_000833 [Enterococcus sp. 8G7_MSG3316]|uniref:FAD-dependent urate hydroxylase HpyO/Asp monooxygenase CreE-like FAD/NAD(P)-binding domain-containing protein n=1 Tax=Candidatus Enterococcus testudinis TaxID=1834191 RepID=A0A242A3Y7_9ENTE|nr:hypothetical protein A5886_000833 [Enterococcus sp. 8G7_MSG3316]
MTDRLHSLIDKGDVFLHIVIIGAGPRGLSLCERLIAHGKKEQLSTAITLIDPYLPGAVWRTEQNQDLLINSVTSQVTLFTDDTLTSGGPVVKGPTLYEWAATHGKAFAQQHAPWLSAFFDQIDSNGHCPRAVYGLYQQWFYQELRLHCPASISLTYLPAEVLSITKESDRFCVKTAAKSLIADQVILATGHGAARLSQEEAALAAFAQQKQLFYAPPANAADVDFTDIQAKKPVILRGLGLAFFDYVTLLTKGRGGRFIEENGQLSYQPSGQEPLIIAGSHRGVPYHPRGKNQKQPTQQRQPAFLTAKRLSAWRQEKQVDADIVFYFLAKEVELVYYQQYLVSMKRSNADVTAFTEAFICQEGQLSVVHDFAIPSAAVWDWSFFEQPFRKKPAEQSPQEFLLHYLKWDLKEASLGNLTGPVSSGLEVLKDLREPLRLILAEGLLSTKALKETFWHSFVPLNSFLSIGPPLQRTRELVALMEAGIVTLLGPEMVVETTEVFLTYAKQSPDHTFQATQMMEARIPTTAVEATANPLIRNLLTQGLIHPAILPIPDQTDFSTGAIAIDPATNLCLDKQNRPQSGLYCFGIPTEGIHWLTAGTAQPGTDAWNLRQADQLAAHIYAHRLSK